jgi:hypothetical protein
MHNKASAPPHPAIASRRVHRVASPNSKLFFHRVACDPRKRSPRHVKIKSEPKSNPKGWPTFLRRCNSRKNSLM